MTILITGGSGTLGTALREHISCIAPGLDELDVTSAESCMETIATYNPDIVIHCAAWTDVAKAEEQKEQCWEINVRGTENMVRASNGRRFIYISTDYVFDGERGNYSEDDIPNPVNFYSLTKLAGELIIRQYPGTLIIRTAFKKTGPWPYPKAFIDQFTSHELVGVIAPQIVQAAKMFELTGVVHIAGERKSMYELAKSVSPDVGQISIKDVAVKLPHDTSLSINKWKKILSASSPAKK